MSIAFLRNELERYEREFTEACDGKDGNALTRLLHDDFVLVNPVGACTNKTEFIVDITSDKTFFQGDRVKTELTFHVEGNLARSVADIEMRGAVGPHDVRGRFVNTAVYVYGGDGWQMLQNTLATYVRPKEQQGSKSLQPFQEPREAVRALDASFDRAAREKDAATLTQLLHKDFCMVNPDGTLKDRDTMVLEILEANMDYERKVTEENIVLNGNAVRNTAVIEMKGIVTDRDVTGSYLNTALYVFEDDRWQMLNNSIAPLGH